ncbi:hypothetical protein MNBD_UNCLBAC01-1045 [hydrothermal vent metagenome]|uniref:HD-GYP domain-containing protein n=1 Tax=hydrothermal vent metagenome TaxID=652676 RepID=A0A3B1DAI8_9ZZZZ
MTNLKKIYTKKLGKLNRTLFMKNKYKSLTLVFIFSLTCIHLFSMAVFPNSFLTSEIILIVVLGLMFFIWIQELKDKRRLQHLNKNLMTAQTKLEQAEVDMMATLILTAEAKDPYTHGHSQRVAKYTLAISKAMGLSTEDQKLFERSAILHDLGKIAIDDNILRKTERLNPAERKIMKEHPQKGIDILKPLKFLNQEKKNIFHHHEMMDGGGYPKGLKGNTIPLGAQIIAVADTFDAMNTSRSYRKALPKEMIIKELKEISGTQLSQKVTKIFLQLLETKLDVWNAVHENTKHKITL